MPDTKDFPFPLDVDVTEQVPVKKVKYDPDTGKVTSITQLESVTTRFMDIPKEKHRCKDGEHFFKVVDKGKGIFTCRDCNYSRMVYPSTYMFVDNQLINKVTGKKV